jgi:Zn-finger nucleic acid-binding protein
MENIMKCPDCQSELKASKLKGINIYECLKCKGKWFERNELMLAKNKADDGLRWFDFDPFGKDAHELSVASDGKICPQCVKKMQSLTYSQSKVVINKCQSCEGVWLTHGELAKIIMYLEKAINSESVKNLAHDTFKEFIKIFTLHKGLISEVKDFLAVLKILEMRIAAEHPNLAQAWANIESVSPIK